MRYFINLRSSFSTVSIKDENGNVLYNVKNAKKISFGYNVLLIDSSGVEKYNIVKKGIGSKYKVFENEVEILEMKKTASLLKPKVSIKSSRGNFSVNGNYYKHKYTLNRDNQEVAIISKKMINLKNEYYFDSNETEDIELLFIISIILDNLAYEHEQSLQSGDSND